MEKGLSYTESVNLIKDILGFYPQEKEMYTILRMWRKHPNAYKSIVKNFTNGKLVEPKLYQYDTKTGRAISSAVLAKGPWCPKNTRFHERKHEKGVLA